MAGHFFSHGPGRHRVLGWDMSWARARRSRYRLTFVQPPARMPPARRNSCWRGSRSAAVLAEASVGQCAASCRAAYSSIVGMTAAASYSPRFHSFPIQRWARSTVAAICRYSIRRDTPAARPRRVRRSDRSLARNAPPELAGRPSGIAGDRYEGCGGPSRPALNMGDLLVLFYHAVSERGPRAVRHALRASTAAALLLGGASRATPSSAR